MAKKKDEMLELAKKQSDALLEADMAALDEQTQRETADALALDALAQTHAAETAAQSAYNQAQYANVGQILNDIQGKIDTAKQKDETALKREKAFRYISGLGDTLSGVANLVGTAHGASNQNQTYNSHAVVQKAEEARKARKLEMDDLSKRLDEMQTRQRDLKAAGSLAEAQLKAKQDRERLELEASQRKAADEAKYKERQMAINEINAQANLKRAEASETNAETKANKPASTAKPKMVVTVDAEGNTAEFDVSRYKNFDKDYQKALDAAIADGTSGLSQEEIEEYQTAVKLAKADSGKALNEFLRTHTYRKSIIDRMGGTGANNPKYQ